MPSLARILLAVLCTAHAAAVPVAARAQAAFPAKPVTLVVSFPPGGAADGIARAVATEMGNQLKQPVVVQNTPGASGAIGAAAIARAAPDGYTIGLQGSAPLTTLPYLQQLNYTRESFDYICKVFEVPVYLLVPQDSPFKSVKDVVQRAAAQPDKVSYATIGPGTLPHLAAADFARAARVQMLHVPYKGEGRAITDLLGKHVDLYFGTNAVATAHNLRRLAVTARTRASESPDTPTFEESGYRVNWLITGGIVAPKALDAGAGARLRSSCEAALQSASVRESIERMKMRTAYAPGDAYERAIAEEARGSLDVLKQAGLVK